MSSEAIAGMYGSGGQALGSPGAQSADVGETTHASVAFYWMIGAVLTVLTAVEVAVFYIPALHPVLVPALLSLSGAKFLLVVLFFMHLRFDSRVFSTVFMAGMVLAMFMTVALVILHKVLPAISL